MREVEVQASKLDSAINQALQELGAKLTQVKVEVLASGGLFKKAKVRVTLNDGEETEKTLVAKQEQSKQERLANNTVSIHSNDKGGVDTGNAVVKPKDAPYQAPKPINYTNVDNNKTAEVSVDNLNKTAEVKKEQPYQSHQQSRNDKNYHNKDYQERQAKNYEHNHEHNHEHNYEHSQERNKQSNNTNNKVEDSFKFNKSSNVNNFKKHHSVDSIGDKNAFSNTGFNNTSGVVDSVNNVSNEDILKACHQLVRVRPDTQPVATPTGEFLQDILNKMGIEGKVCTYVQDKHLDVFIDSVDSSLIGYRGETLDSLELLTSLFANRGEGEFVRVSVDTQDFRAKRVDTLVQVAKNSANRASRTGRRVELEPMGDIQRKIIHTALQSDSRVKTHSDGNGIARFIVIYPKKQR